MSQKDYKLLKGRGQDQRSPSFVTGSLALNIFIRLIYWQSKVESLTVEMQNPYVAKKELQVRGGNCSTLAAAPDTGFTQWNPILCSQYRFPRQTKYTVSH